MTALLHAANSQLLHGCRTAAAGMSRAQHGTLLDDFFRYAHHAYQPAPCFAALYPQQVRRQRHVARCLLTFSDVFDVHTML